MVVLTGLDLWTKEADHAGVSARRGETGAQWMAILAVSIAVLAPRTGAGGITLDWVRRNWPQAMFDPTHDGFNRYENQVGPSTVDSLALRWEAELGTSTAYASPIVANGRVFVGDDGSHLNAFNAITGHLLWSASSGGFYVGSAAYGDGLVFAESIYGPLNAYRAATGRLAWTFPCSGGFRASPLVSGNVVVATCTDGTVYSLEGPTGKIRWSTSVGCCVFDQAPAQSNGVLYQLSTAHTLTALRTTDGTALWSVPAFAVGTVAVSGGLVFYNDYPNVVAVNAGTGATVWEAPVLSIQPTGSPAVADGLVYVQGGTLIALHASSGTTAWTTDASSAFGPIVANGIVYASSTTSNFRAEWDAYDAVTGGQLARFRTSAGTCFSGACTNTVPVIADGTLYLAGPGPGLSAYRLPSPGSQ
jgi:outer membrane protein assembly factor BamB